LCHFAGSKMCVKTPAKAKNSNILSPQKEAGAVKVKGGGHSVGGWLGFKVQNS